MSAALNFQAILAKRYAQSLLYDASNGRYISVEQLREWLARWCDLRRHRPGDRRGYQGAFC
jgi:hypothetical protein